MRLAFLLLDGDAACAQRGQQGHRLDELVLKHAPVELRRRVVELAFGRMADIEHVGERVPLVQAQGLGLGPPDHQRTQLVPQCPFRRPVVHRLRHAGARVLQALQAAVQVPADDGGR